MRQMLPISIKRPSATLTGFKTEVFKKKEGCRFFVIKISDLICL
jgi:hypothetical protein